MLTIACYSLGTSYEAEAVLLSRSLDRVGMAHRIEGFASRGDWYANTAYKADFIRDMRDSIVGPMLYVDVDAFVHANCDAYFDKLGAAGVDFGVHFFAGPSGGNNRRDVCDCIRGRRCSREHRLLSGTLFFGDSNNARTLLNEWCRYNHERRDLGLVEGGGQKNLWATWKRLSGVLNTTKLPGRFCYVFDKVWAYPPREPCIVEHTIASRDNRPYNDGRAKTTTNVARSARKAALAVLVGLA